jgi:hypothetical protein
LNVRQRKWADPRTQDKNCALKAME